MAKYLCTSSVCSVIVEELMIYLTAPSYALEILKVDQTYVRQTFYRFNML